MAANNLANELYLIGRFAESKAIVMVAYDRLAREYDACHPHAAGLQIVIAGTDAGLAIVRAAWPGTRRRSRATSAVIRSSGLAAASWRRTSWCGAMSRRRAGSWRRSRRAGGAVRGCPGAGVGDGAADGRPGAASGAGRGCGGGAARLVDEGGEEVRTDAVRLGDVALREGDAGRAIEHLQAAARTDLARRPVARGLYAFTLARALRATGGAEDRIAGLLAEAVQAYTVLGASYAGRVAEIEAWARARGDRRLFGQVAVSPVVRDR